MLNVTEVTFCGLQKVFIDGLYQWDYGQYLTFPDLSLPDTYETHFAQGDETCTVIGGSDGVRIPDAYLQNAEQITAYIYLHEGADDGETEYVVGIPVLARPEPSEGTPTPVQQDAITQAIAALNSAVNEADQYATNADISAQDAEQSAREAAQSAQDAAESAASIDTSSFATKEDYANTLHLTAQTLNELQKNKARNNIDVPSKIELQSMGGTLTNMINSLSSNTVHLDTQTLTDAQKEQARTNIDVPSQARLHEVATSLSNGLTSLQNNTVHLNDAQTLTEDQKAQARQNIGAITASEVPVQSVNGQTGAVTLPTATTSANGLMSSQDKSRLDDLYADYSSAMTALGV